MRKHEVRGIKSRAESDCHTEKGRERDAHVTGATRAVVPVHSVFGCRVACLTPLCPPPHGDALMHW